jgi:hypothetical protein
MGDCSSAFPSGALLSFVIKRLYAETAHSISVYIKRGGWNGSMALLESIKSYVVTDLFPNGAVDM